MFVRAVRGAPTKRLRRNSAQPGVRGRLPAGRVDGAFVCLLGGAGGRWFWTQTKMVNNRLGLVRGLKIDMAIWRSLIQIHPR